MKNKIITVKDYLDHYGKMMIINGEKVFVSDGISSIGGKLKAKDFHREGMF